MLESPSSARDFAPLQALGNYQLVAEIGHGGMAQVFLAVPREQRGVERPVVVKRLRTDVGEDEDFRAMFMAEANLAMRFVHPHVVRTYDAGKEHDVCYIVMEFLDGQPLSRIRREGHRRGRVPLAVQLRILADVLSGLDYVHKLTDARGEPLGIVHRDVTPQNVFISYDGQVKVVDFGVAKTAASVVETRVGVVKGKLSYMAPEHARGESIDHRSDLFAVGVMLWEAVMGQRFWHGHEDVTIYRRLVLGDLPLGGNGREIADPLMALICRRALAADAKDRFQTAGEMRGALLGALVHLDAAGTPGVGVYVSGLFSAERAHFHLAVEEELRRVRRGIRSGGVPLLGGPDSGRSPPSNSEVHTWQSTRPRVSQTMIEDARILRRRRARGWVLAGGVLAAVFALSNWVGRRVKSPERPLAAAPSTIIAPLASVSGSPAVPEPAVSMAMGSPAIPAEAQPHLAPRPHPASRPHAEPSAPVDEFRRTSHVRRTLDAEDPWAP